MKKNLLFLIAFFVFAFSFATNVDAYCSTKKFNDMKAIAYKATVSYELKFDERHNSYFTLTVTNVDKSILVLFGGSYYEPVNGVVNIDSRLAGGTTYEVKLYGGYGTHCVEEYLYSKRITVPKYNKYSERDECIEYEEFPLCNKWYSGIIDNDNYFLSQLNEYIISLNKQDNDEIPVKDKNFFEKVIDFYMDHLAITLTITIIILLFIAYRIIVRLIRRKNRVKLNSK